MNYLTCSPGRNLGCDSESTGSKSPCRFYVCHKERGMIVNCTKFETVRDYRMWIGTRLKIGRLENLYFETFCDCDPHLDTLRLMACHKRMVACDDKLKTTPETPKTPDLCDK